jgi:hypothetical protein
MSTPSTYGVPATRSAAAAITPVVRVAPPVMGPVPEVSPNLAGLTQLELWTFMEAYGLSLNARVIYYLDYTVLLTIEPLPSLIVPFSFSEVIQETIPDLLSDTSSTSSSPSSEDLTPRP